MYKSVNEIDWENWDPVERATLMFVIQDGQILLIHKKRGFGKGKINGPGGKMEPGETPRECAIRETQVPRMPGRLERLAHYVQREMGGFEIDGWRFRTPSV